MQVDYDIGQPKMACQVASLTYLLLVIAFILKESSREISIHQVGKLVFIMTPFGINGTRASLQMLQSSTAGMNK